MNCPRRMGKQTLIDKAKKLTGGIIGTVKMVDCVTYHPSCWFVGPYGFVFHDPRWVKFKPLKGRLGIFEVGSFDEIIMSD